MSRPSHDTLTRDDTDPSVRVTHDRRFEVVPVPRKGGYDVIDRHDNSRYGSSVWVKTLTEAKGVIERARGCESYEDRWFATQLHMEATS